MTLVCFCGSGVVCPIGYWTIYRQINIVFMINIEKYKVHKRFRDIQDSTVPGLSIVNRFDLPLVF